MAEARLSGREGKEAVRLDPRLLEFLDRWSLRLLSRKYPSIPRDARTALFMEQECAQASLDAVRAEWIRHLERFKSFLRGCWISDKSEDHVFYREFRYDLAFLVRDEVASRGFRKIGTDMAVPDENGEAMLDFYLRELGESGIDYVIFGHLGDNHLHANLLPKTQQEFQRAKVLYDRSVGKALELGGTVSAEHGIGKLKVPYLELMYGREAVGEMARLKSALDPHGILSPGNLFPVELLGH